MFEVGSGTSLKGNFEIYDHSFFQCGERCAFAKHGLIYMIEAKVKIGDNFTIEDHYSIHALKHSSILIGDDCMMSYRVVMRTNDGHTIFDLETGNNVNSTEEICKNRCIQIGNHVWIGMDTAILYHSEIADGSVIGAKSLVKSKIPNNCIAAGVPARVIRENIAWCRNDNAFDLAECELQYRNRTENI